MAVFVLFTLALIAGSACAVPSRIVGGTETSVEKYPSIVQVDSLGIFSGVWGHSCGANILTTRYVLSAAHCFEGLFYDISRRRIRAGTSYRNTGGVISYAAAAYNHPSYGIIRYDGDISVILLREPLVYSPVIQQGAIPQQGFQIPDNLPVVHAGWGHTQWLGQPSPVLQETTIFTINRQLCHDRYLVAPNPGVITENMICAGLLDVGGRDACQGDSGGPLYHGDIIIGIVSWGHECANATWPGVSAAVSSYTNWIVSVAV